MNKNDVKKEILLNSFETLKNDVSGNDEALEKIIIKLLAIDSKLAIEMWKYLFNQYREFDSYSIVDEYCNFFGLNKLAELIISDIDLRNQVFLYDRLGYNKVVGYLIDNNDLKNANGIIELIYNNKNLMSSFAEELETIINPYCNNISKEGVEMLFYWASKLNGNEKAKINVALVDYL